MRLRRILLLLVVACLPICFTTFSSTVPDVLRNITVGTVKPVLGSAHFVSSNISGGLSKIKDYLRAYEENAFLRTRVYELNREAVRATEFEKENARLRKLLNFKEKEKIESTAACVILRDISHWSNWVVIDKGKKDGIAPDATLVTYDGLAGRVVFVEDTCSRAMLITDIESKVGAVIQETRDMGVVEGDGRRFLTLRYLPLDSEVKVGDTVLTSGLGGVYPRGLPVGRVEMIGEDKGKLTLFATLKPFCDFSRLEEVLCLEYTREN